MRYLNLAESRKKGFTLIELLVVITIIGILSALIVVSLNLARSRARDTKRVSDIKNLSVALELYYQANGTFPAALSSVVTAGYIQAIPVDPINAVQGGVTFQYKYFQLSSGQSYHLGGPLENDNDALDDDADNITDTNFRGDNKGCGTTVLAPELCFDLVP
jgi:prepilin-type N-terminal cleavage/methylation domain-containing protein